MINKHILQKKPMEKAPSSAGNSFVGVFEK